MITTVFITDAHDGPMAIALPRYERNFGDNFPASALITVAGSARPEMLVDVQGIAVLGRSQRLRGAALIAAFGFTGKQRESL